nr:uncharacterized protein CTRU02_03377 [Colletotrichum truncatum]KAF6797346.1 hypothetical protein CTRU02_03377 [Colletotrichum truncatum]
MLETIRKYLCRCENRPRPLSQAEISKRSLVNSSPIISGLLVISAFTAAALLSIFISLSQPQKNATIIALSVVFFIAQCLSLIIYITHRCISPPPNRPGKTIFVYFFLWIIIQGFGFILIHCLWKREWPESLKNWAHAWMFLSIATMALWAYAIITILGRMHYGRIVKKDLETLRVAATRQHVGGRDVSDADDEKATYEHVECCQPPLPAYFTNKARR